MRWPSACPASPCRPVRPAIPPSSAPSYVLRALRITLGRYTGAADVDYLLQGVRSALS